MISIKLILVLVALFSAINSNTCDGGYTQPVYRWYNPTTYDYFYVLDPAGEIASSSGYHYEKVAWYDLVAQETGSVPIYRFWNGAQHFYTTDYNEAKTVLTEGYTYEGIIGYVWSSYQSGTYGIYRYYNSKTGTHFYTIDPKNENCINSAFKLEGIIGYAYSCCYCPQQQTGTCPVKGQYPPPQQGKYPPLQGTPPPQQGKYPPLQGTPPPQQVKYPPLQGNPPPQQGKYPPLQGTPPKQGSYPPNPPVCTTQQNTLATSIQNQVLNAIKNLK